MSTTPAMDDHWGNEEGQKLPDGFAEAMPRPQFFRVLIMPVRPQTVSKGGIVIPEEAQKAQRYLTYVGQIMAAGPQAFDPSRFTRNERPLDDSALPKVGDWVIYGRYAGQRIECMGVRLLVVNDDEILAVVQDPTVLRVHV